MLRSLPCPYCRSETITYRAEETYKTGCPKCDIYVYCSTAKKSIEGWNYLTMEAGNDRNDSQE